jgi:hypothetical protein
MNEQPQPPRPCFGGEEHDIELVEMNVRDGYDRWECLLCGLGMEVRRSLEPPEEA